MVGNHKTIFSMLASIAFSFYRYFCKTRYRNLHFWANFQHVDLIFMFSGSFEYKKKLDQIEHYILVINFSAVSFKISIEGIHH